MPSVAGGVAAVVVALAIYAGQPGLRYFDAALVGYATATVFLAFGVVYRYAVWVSSPPARRYLRRGWQAFFSWRNFRRLPTAVPRSVLGYLGFQTFLRARGRGRWIAHQLLFWGVVLATLITFPLTFGWLAFFSDTATGPGYTIYVLGFPTVSFDALSFLGWVVFHGLDIAAVLVLAGCGWFLWRRFRHREATTGQRFGYDFFPLIGLVAISVTGLLLTFSSWLLEGRSYDFLAIAHMATVVLTLVFIPFGKFFHVIQRPASVGVEIYKRSALERDGVFPCRRCGEPWRPRRSWPTSSRPWTSWSSASRSGPRPARAASGSSAARPTWTRSSGGSGERGPLPGGGPRGRRLPRRRRGRAGRPLEGDGGRRAAGPDPLLLLRRPVRHVPPGDRGPGDRGRAPQPRHQQAAAVPQGGERLPAGPPPGPAAQPADARHQGRAAAPGLLGGGPGPDRVRDPAHPVHLRARRLRGARRGQHDHREDLPDGQVRPGRPAHPPHRLQRAAAWSRRRPPTRRPSASTGPATPGPTCSRPR